jgi:hypothetical protein
MIGSTKTYTNIRIIVNNILFIKLPENPRLSSLGMNGARSEAE